MIAAAGTYLEIDSRALLNNYRVLSGMLGRERLAPVLKSEAYGHGFAACYGILKGLEPRVICVNSCVEAERLRGFGYEGRILVLGPILAGDFEVAFSLGLELLLHSREQLESWSRSSQRCAIHLKVDSGLGRRGLNVEELHLHLPLLRRLQGDIVAIGSHFANVEDVMEQGYAREQLGVLDRAYDLLVSGGVVVQRHCAASAAALLIPDSRYDLCRVGIALYGLWPSALTSLSYRGVWGDLDLQPVLSWRARFCQVREVGSGDYIGYGCTFRASKRMLVGVLPVGYYEGYPWVTAGSGAYVLVRGVRCHSLGRVSMNMMVVDLSDVGLRVGDDFGVATLLGRDGEERVSAEDLAGWASTINYEVVTRLNPHLSRVVV